MSTVAGVEGDMLQLQQEDNPEVLFLFCQQMCSGMLVGLELGRDGSKCSEIFNIRQSVQRS